MEEVDVEYENMIKAQSLVDLTQQDILHYIEANSFSASDGYKLAKQIKDIRQERREIKIEMDTIKLLKEKVSKYKGVMTDANMSVAKLEQKERYKQTNAVYHNRVLDKVI